MLRKVKKTLSGILALGVLVSAIPTSVGAEEGVPQISVNADNLTVNSTNTGFVDLPSYVTSEYNNLRDETVGRIRAYELSNVYGLGADESVIEFVAREQRQNEPQFLLSGIEFSTDSDFYITQDIYIGEMRSEDIIQLGGRYYDANGSKVDALLYLDGDGSMVKSYGHTYAGKQYGGAYQPNNWYRVTMAVTNKDVKLYLDDQVAHQRIKNGVLQERPGISISCDLPDVGRDFSLGFFGTRTRSYADVTDWSGLPQSYAVKEMKIVEGTYNPANTDTTISSSTYTIQDLSTYFVGGKTDAASSVSGIAANTTVDSLLANITAPTGATKKVVKVNADDKATTIMAGNAMVTSAMKLMVTAVDGAMKFYDLDAEVSANMLPSITSTLQRYVIDENAKTITMPATSVEKLSSVIVGENGTTVTVKDAKNNTVTSGTVRDTMKLVAENNGIEYKYSIEINTTIVYDTSSTLT